ncbi:MAG: glutamate synthase subunit alpha, partial [Betaproteobacteria bacterium]
MNEPQGLYHPANEHDACGVGFVAHIKGKKSHSIVEQGLTVLRNLTHRGAVGWDPKLSDGAGLLIQIPDKFLREVMARQGLKLPPPGQYGVGIVFLPRDPASRFACEYEIERAIKDEGQILLSWRDVPVDNSDIAEPAKRIEPVIRQVFIGRGKGVTVTDALERKLYIIRKSSGHAIQALKLAHGKEFYVPSMSARTACYKGMLLAHQVGQYYKDLQDARVESALALVHQRFSTNTFPSWDLAHPFRMICHNGEINTLRGNVNWIRARQGAISSPVLGRDLEKIWPLIYDGQSDSASFDNALELLVMGGYSVAHAMMMMIPEAWENHTLMDPTRRAFYEYHAAMMEPWDGPASIAFTDGRQIGATLDRNGLRPSRYIVTADDLVIMGSECGCLPVPEEKIVKKWRLQPGRMFLVDLEKGRIIDDEELKNMLAGAKPYAEWIDRIRVKLDEVETEKTPPLKSSVRMLDRQQAFGYTQEDIKFIMTPMATNGEEPVGSMGNDSPLAVLSDKNKTLYHYFKQLFAQVTNPPIDPIREELVTSLVSFIGPKPNLLGIDEMNPPLRLEVSQPVLDFFEMEKIRHIERYTGGKFRSLELDITYPIAWGKEAVEARLASLCAQAEDAVRAGYSIIVISDRLVERERVAIPALLALSAIHQHLVAKGLRTSAGLVVETGSVREVHHFALLGGYGAEAVHPYLALETLLDLAAKGELGPDLDGRKAIKNFVKAIGKGLKKVMSKMGTSTYMSYTGAQIFEAVGLARSLVDKYFTGTTSSIEGIGVFEVAEEAIRIHRAAFEETDPVLQSMLDAGGEYAWRVRGEEHMWTPDAIAKLQHSARQNSPQAYKEYAAIINDQSRRHMTFRGLFEFRLDRVKPVPIEEVEPAAEIVKRFSTGAMSHGSISVEAHTTLAVAMNRIGGKSNTGEGGEDRKRYATVKAGETLRSRLGANRVARDIELREGDVLKSKIKQVASGRFGVTAEYLASAEQIQIKIAQGAKPGEGGQLPGRKVSDYIAEIRYSTPGVELISPPPHHDIYSIEDLAQLIHDLK